MQVVRDSKVLRGNVYFYLNASLMVRKINDDFGDPADFDALWSHHIDSGARLISGNLGT